MPDRDTSVIKRLFKSSFAKVLSWTILAVMAVGIFIMAAT